MNQYAKIEIEVDPETAAALSDPHRLDAVARLVDRMVRPSAKDDPLAAVLEAAAGALPRGGRLTPTQSSQAACS